MTEITSFECAPKWSALWHQPNLLTCHNIKLCNRAGYLLGCSQNSIFVQRNIRSNGQSVRGKFLMLHTFIWIPRFHWVVCGLIDGITWNWKLFWIELKNCSKNEICKHPAIVKWCCYFDVPNVCNLPEFKPVRRKLSFDEAFCFLFKIILIFICSTRQGPKNGQG